MIVDQTITASFLRLFFSEGIRYKFMLRKSLKLDFQYYAIEHILRSTAEHDFATECAEKHCGGGIGEERKTQQNRQEKYHSAP